MNDPSHTQPRLKDEDQDNQIKRLSNFQPSESCVKLTETKQKASKLYANTRLDQFLPGVPAQAEQVSPLIAPHTTSFRGYITANVGTQSASKHASTQGEGYVWLQFINANLTVAGSFHMGLAGNLI